MPSPKPRRTSVRIADHTASEHRFGFEGFASTGLNTPATIFPTSHPSAFWEAKTNERPPVLAHDGKEFFHIVRSWQYL
jgi:hypothetical protein